MCEEDEAHLPVYVHILPLLLENVNSGTGSLLMVLVHFKS